MSAADRVFFNLPIYSIDSFEEFGLWPAAQQLW
jgi:hypothetical protein